jgi:hypothetical protein
MKKKKQIHNNIGHTLKKIGVLRNPENGEKSFDGAVKPKKVLLPGYKLETFCT